MGNDREWGRPGFKALKVDTVVLLESCGHMGILHDSGSCDFDITRVGEDFQKG